MFFCFLFPLKSFCSIYKHAARKAFLASDEGFEKVLAASLASFRLF